MKRVCFTLRIRKDKIEAYLAAHKVWPELLEAIREAGIRNYSLFMGKDGLAVGYFEADDPDEALRRMCQTDVNRRWQEKMAEFIEGGGDLKKGGVTWLEPYFYLA
ncbi:MAG: L-rhamnose mutarotase [Phycisphaerae bacterium]